jgi:hypothetical protein
MKKTSKEPNALLKRAENLAVAWLQAQMGAQLFISN